MAHRFSRSESKSAEKIRPRFLWDYDLSEKEVRTILQQSDLTGDKRWLIERLLQEARFDEVMSYLSLEDIAQALPLLRLPPKLRAWWDYALHRWLGRGMHHG